MSQPASMIAPPRRLVIASHNEGKVAEIGQMLAPFSMQVISAAALSLPEPEETGSSFAENAALKACAAAVAAREWALADDSGLCVEALGDAPGIYSARWAEGKDFAAAFERIERELRACHATAPHKAYFMCVLCLASPDGVTQFFEGRVDGTLTFPPRGVQGFGYDPIFVPANSTGDPRSFAEITPAEKNSLSHRWRAFQKFSYYLQHWR